MMATRLLKNAEPSSYTRYMSLIMGDDGSNVTRSRRSPPGGSTPSSPFDLPPPPPALPLLGPEQQPHPRPRTPAGPHPRRAHTRRLQVMFYFYLINGSFAYIVYAMLFAPAIGYVEQHWAYLAVNVFMQVTRWNTHCSSHHALTTNVITARICRRPPLPHA